MKRRSGHIHNFDDLIKNIRRREQDMDRVAAHQSQNNKHNRRFKAPDGDDDDVRDSNKGKGKDYSNGKQKPYIP